LDIEAHLSNMTYGHYYYYYYYYYYYWIGRLT
jgi:hypothetical protein